MKINTDVIKKGGALALAAVIGGAGFAVVDNPEPQVLPDPTTLAALEAANSHVGNLTAEVAALKALPPVIVKETVKVDSPNLELVLDHLKDANGNVEYLTDDLDDDEIGKIVERVIAINEAKMIAANKVRAEAADELDGESMTLLDNSTFRFDESDIERVKVQDDDGEIVIEDQDFDDNEFDVLVTVRFEQDDVDFEADFLVEIKEGKFDDLSLQAVRQR